MLFGGARVGNRRYCGKACAARDGVLQLAREMPADLVRKTAQAWRNGACPHCKKSNGPIDVYADHRVHSMVLMTQWRTRRTVCCRRCGRRRQLGSAAYSLGLGWWGFPWGLLVTPIQVGRNLAGAFQAAPASHSPDFERVVREQLARQAMQNAAPPPIAAERR
jgi:hypothetical protein